MMNSRCLCAALVLSSFSIAAGQPGAVRGRVLDPSGAAVPAATVTLHNRDGSQVRTARTDGQGRYEITRLAPAWYAAIAEAPDFAPSPDELFDVAPGETLDRDLRLGTVRVPARYVVTASATVQSLDEIAKAFDVVNPAELRRRAVTTAAEALRQTSGLRVMQLGGPGSLARIHARGLRTFDTSVLIDGFRFRDSSAPQGDATAFVGDLLLVDTDRIEILRGSGSSLYGTHAIGGVVNLVSSAGGGPLRGEVQTAGGGLGLYHGVVKLGGGARSDRIRYSGGVGHLGVTSGIDGDDRVRNSSAHGSLQAFAGPRTSFSGRLFANDTLVGLNSSPFAAPVAQLPPQLPVPALEGRTFFTSMNDPDSRRVSRFASSLLSAAHQISPRASVRAGYQFLRTRRDNRNGTSGPGFQPLFNTANRFEGRLDTVQLRADVHAGRPHLLSFGYEFEREDYDNLSTDENPTASARTRARVLVNQSSHAVFAQDQIRTLGDRLQMSFSGRMQGFRLSAPEFTGGAPRYAGIHLPSPPTAYTGDAALSYFVPSSGTKLRAHAGNSYRAPTLYERFGYSFFFGSFSAFGDPRIAPERALSVDAGLDQYLAGSRLRLSGTWFYTRLQEVIGFDFSGIINARTDPYGRSSGYRNTGGGLSRGFEFAAEARPTRSLNLRSSYTFTNADERVPVLLGGSLRSIRVSSHMYTAVVAQQLGRGLDVGFDFFAASDYLWQMFAGGNRPYLFAGPKKADVVLSYTRKLGEKSSFRAYSRIENAFHRTYYEDGFRTPGAWAVVGVQWRF